jgi:SAM-dependent methyltransferase
MKRDLFALSIARGNEYTKLLTEKPEYGELVTFAECKRQPIYNWFYYKEGYSGELVGRLLRELDVKGNSMILDPFCGTGNTLLACKQRGYNAVGFDILPLGVFVSNTKLQEDYDMELLYEKIGEIARLKFGETALKWPDLGFIDVRKSFSRYARKDILFFKEKIMEVEDEKIRNFLLLGLLSVVIPSSNVKRDGGVLKIVRKKHLPPIRHLLKNKLKRMYKDLKKAEPSPGVFAEARLGDARSLDLEQDSVDACITSPPYLNWVDYTKIYGFELALLADSEEIKIFRRKSMRSHVGAEYGKSIKLRSERIGEILDRISESPGFVKHPQVVEGYFEDIYMSLRSVHESLKEKGKAALVVGNVCLPGVTVDTDLILAELAEDIGFDVREIMVANVRWCDVHGIRKERPVRESVVVLEK